MRLQILSRPKVDAAQPSTYIHYYRPQRKENVNSAALGLGLTKNGSLKGKGKWKF